MNVGSHWLRLLCARVCVLVALFFVSACSGQPEVSLSLGKLRGVIQETYNGRKINAFLGIPYAKPPIGELRFKEPVPCEPWNGTLEATAVANICLQSQKRNVGSEDCLYLNVYSPKIPSQQDGSKLLDVNFVIHGGGFQNGHGHQHGPGYLLDEEDIVLVTMNYRLGILGFLSLQDSVMPGNFGLKDQLLALEWVRKNIAAFGGDPNKITLTGCSAGAASVHFHMISPKSKGLFQKAIALSGSVLNPWAIARRPRANALFVAESLGCPTTTNSQEIADCLRSKPAEVVMSQVELFMKFLGFDSMTINPVVEEPSSSAFLDRYPEEIIRSGDASDVPFLISHTDDDALFLSAEVFTNSSAVKELESNWNKMLPLVFSYDVDQQSEPRVGQAIRKFYLGDKGIVEGAKQFTQLFTERFLTIGIQEMALLHAKKYKSPVYMYIITHTGGKRLSDSYNHSHLYKGGAVHADDFLYVYGSDFIKKRNGDPIEEAMSKTMIKILMQFIRENPVAGWKTVQSSLPQLAYLEVAGPDKSGNVFKTLSDFSSALFWKSLDLEENKTVGGKNRACDEL